MNKTLFGTLILIIAGFFYQGAQAQVKFNVRVNLGSQPAWGPTGYDHVDYYYLPDTDCYYDVNAGQFVYFSRGRWIYARTLPARYGRVDLYNTYKVVVNEPRPYQHADVYRQKYGSYRGHHDQQVIRDSHEEKYFVVRDHPRHAEWQRNHGRDDRDRHNDDRDRHNNDHDHH